MAKNTMLKDIHDIYKGVNITRENEKTNYRRGGSTKTIVKYSVMYKGVPVYFKTQKDVKDFIDKSDIQKSQF